MILEDVVIEVPDVPLKQELKPIKHEAQDAHQKTEETVLVIKLKWS